MKNKDELLYQPAHITASETSEIFSRVDAEINEEHKKGLDEEDAEYLEQLVQNEVDDQDEESEADDVAPRLKSLIGKQGDVNRLYAEYVAAKCEVNGSLPSQLAVEQAKSKLLADVTNYALRVFASEGYQGSLNGIVGEDLAQDVTIKVFKNLDGFQGQSKVSTWLFRVIKNAVANAVHKEEVRAESPLNDEIIHPETRTDVDAVTTGSVKIANDPSIAFNGTDGSDDHTSSESNGKAVYSPSVLHAAELGVTTDITLQESIRRLSLRDQRICKLLSEGYKTDEIAAELNLEKKQIYNLVARLRETLKHELYVLEVVLHTCRLTAKPVEPNQKIVGYVADDKEFRAIGLTCRCRKGVTRKEARRMVELGEAQEVHHIKDGKFVLDSGRIWATQATRVPRVGLTATTRAGIERAFVDGSLQVQRDIEIAHEMDLAWRAKLFAYEEDLVARGINPHEWDGRAMGTWFKNLETSEGLDKSLPSGDVGKPRATLLRMRPDGLIDVLLREGIEAPLDPGVTWSGAHPTQVELIQPKISKTEVSTVIVVKAPILGETSVVSATLSI